MRARLEVWNAKDLWWIRSNGFIDGLCAIVVNKPLLLYEYVVVADNDNKRHYWDLRV